MPEVAPVSESEVAPEVSPQLAQPERRPRPTPCCANCGATWHYNRSCNQPVMSFGVVVHREVLADAEAGVRREYLVVQRRDTFAYVEFIRGKYDYRNRAYLTRLFENMTEQERAGVAAASFRALWQRFWGAGSALTRADFRGAQACFERLRGGYSIRQRDGAVVELSAARLLAGTRSRRAGPQWGFPKGRRAAFSETNLNTAFRELEEETGLSRGDLAHVWKKPFFEQYTGENGIRYEHIYFRALLTGASVGQSLRICKRELSCAKWATAAEVLDLIQEERERCELFRRIDRLNDALYREKQSEQRRRRLPGGGWPEAVSTVKRALGDVSL